MFFLVFIVSGEKLNELNNGEKEQEMLKNEINKLRSQYEALIHQLQLMEKLMNEHQVNAQQQHPC